MKLKNAEINVGRLCNNRCLFCMSGEDRDQKDPWINPERVQAEIRRHYVEGARSVGFLGGEPSAYPHIEECVRFAKDLGFQRIALCTNGTRLSNKDFIDKLVVAGLTRVTVSIHSHRPEVEDWITGVPGNLKRKLQALSNLVELRRLGKLPDNVSVNPVLSRRNMRDMEAYVRYLHAEVGVEDFRFNFIWPQSRALRDETIIPRFEEAVPWMLNLIRVNERELGLHVTFGAVPFCILPKPFQERWPLLEKYFYDEGNDLPTSVSFPHNDEVETVDRFDWHARSRDDYRTKVEACSRCRLNDKCMGIYRTYLELYGESEFKRVQ